MKKPELHPLFSACLIFSLVAVLPACGSTMQGLKEDFDTLKTKLVKKDGDTATTQNASPITKTVATKPSGSAPQTYKGFSKPLVQEIQTKLKKLEYYEGSESGQYDATTETAIQDFQLENDLTVDGKPSVSLLRVINSKFPI